MKSSNNKANENLNKDIKNFINIIISHWYYFAISIILFTTGAFLYLRYKLPLYNVRSTILIDADGNYGIENILESFDPYGAKNNLSNEIGLLKSYSTIYKTLQNLDFDVSYYVKGTVRNVEVYHQSPIVVKLDTSRIQMTGAPFYVKILSDSTYRIIISAEDVNLYKKDKATSNGKIKSFSHNKVYRFGQPVYTDYFSFIIYREPENDNIKKDDELYFIINDLFKLADRYVSAIEIEALNKTSSILQLSISGPVVEKEVTFLNKLSDVYIQNELDDKIKITDNTLDFINSQILEINDSLINAESQLQNFRTSEKVMDLSSTAESAFSQLERLEAERAVLLVKDKYYKYILDYIKRNSDIDKLVAPSAIGIDDPLLNNLIAELTKLNSEKTALTFSAKDKNPTFNLLELKIETAKKTLAENVTNIINASTIALNDNIARINKVQGLIDKLPKTERDLVKIQRKFNLSDHIYNFLLEKRAEVGIARASIKADNKILDRAKIDSKNPGTPNKLLVYLVNLFFGMIAPVAYLYIKSYFNDTITDKEQILNYSDIPLLGIVGHNKTSSVIPLIDSPKSYVSESLRSIRVNLQYVAPQINNKVIGITSSVSGEGKTFFAINLASSLAISGSKVVILGADLRKPKLNKVMKLENFKGISTYLINQSTKEEIIQKTSVNNLDVIVSGPIPPNPTELLGLNQMKTLIDYLKTEYDYIIVDAPPVGLVADYYLISNLTDANIFIIRQGYTKLNMLHELESTYKPKMKNLFVVFNDVKAGLTKYGYRYGYSYGYGYGYGYYEEKPMSKLNIFKKILSKSSKQS